MNISLIAPRFLSGSSFLQQPLDLLYSASLLEKAGHNTKVIDVRAKLITLIDLVKLIEDSDAIVVTTTPYDQVQNYFVDYRYAYSVTTINYIKSHLPKIPLLVCGSHGTVRPDLILKDMNFDILIKGEYEYALLDVIDALGGKKELKEVPNIIIKRKDEVIKTQENDLLLHPEMKDDLFPAYDKVDMNSYFGDHYINNVPLRRRRWAVVQASRGCPYSCSFCFNFWGKRVRFRSPESIVEEMELLEKKYGIEEIFFIDFTFTLNKKWVSEICENILKKGLKIKWTVETRCDLIDKEIVTLMARANCRSIWLGIESFDDNILQLNNKGYKSSIVIPAIITIKDAGIEPHAFIMIGMPGETVETLNNTISEIYKLKIPYTKSIITCTPRFGTDYYETAKKQYPLLGDSWYDLNMVRGQVGNEMKPHIIQKAISIMKNRNFTNEISCPQV